MGRPSENPGFLHNITPGSGIKNPGFRMVGILRAGPECSLMYTEMLALPAHLQSVNFGYKKHKFYKLFDCKTFFRSAGQNGHIEWLQSKKIGIFLEFGNTGASAQDGNFLFIGNKTIGNS